MSRIYIGQMGVPSMLLQGQNIRWERCFLGTQARVWSACVTTRHGSHAAQRTVPLTMTTGPAVAWICLMWTRSNA